MTCTCGAGAAAPILHAAARHATRISQTRRLTARWMPKTRNWEVSRKPATKDMTSTAVGHAVQATAKRKPMSASADMNMQIEGNRQVRQKKKYEPYTSFAKRYGHTESRLARVWRECSGQEQRTRNFCAFAPL